MDNFTDNILGDLLINPDLWLLGNFKGEYTLKLARIYDEYMYVIEPMKSNFNKYVKVTWFVKGNPRSIEIKGKKGSHIYDVALRLMKKKRLTIDSSLV
jgi:hypothetical protein